MQQQSERYVVIAMSSRYQDAHGVRVGPVCKLVRRDYSQERVAERMLVPVLTVNVIDILCVLGA
jgi:hypothetical protein